MVCYDFYKRSGVRCSPQGRNSGQKKRIDLTLRKNLTPRSSESGFHRNVKFATFEEAGRLGKFTVHGFPVPSSPCLVCMRVRMCEQVSVGACD